MMGRIARILSWTIAGILVVLALTSLALDLGWQRDRIVGYAAGLAEDRLGTEVSIERASGRIHQGLRFAGVRIGSAEDPLLWIEQVVLDWRLANLLGAAEEDVWKIDSIRLEGAKLSLRRTAEGRFERLDTLLERVGGGREEDPGEATSSTILIDHIILADARVQLAVSPAGVPDLARSAVASNGTDRIDRPWQISGSVDGEAHAIALRPKQAATVDRISLSARLDEQVAVADSPFRSGHLLVETEGEVIRHADARLEGAFGTLAARAMGRLDALDSVVLSLDVDRLDRLRTLSPELADASGRARVRADLAGPASALMGSVRIELERAVALDMRAETLTVDARFAEAIPLTIESLREADMTLSIEGEGIDLGARHPARVPPMVFDLRFTGAMRGGLAELDDAVLRAPGVHLNARGRGDLEALESLSLEFDVQDLGPWLAEWTGQSEIGGRARGSATIEGAIDDPRGEARLELEDLTLDGLGLGSVRAEIERTRDVRVASRPAPTALGIRWQDVEGEVAALSLEDTGRPAEALLDVAAEARFARPFLEAAPADWPSFSATGVISHREHETRLTLDRLEAAARGLRLRSAEDVEILATAERLWSLRAPRLELLADVAADPEPGSGQIALAASGRDRRPSALEVELDSVPLALIDRLANTGRTITGSATGSTSIQFEARSEARIAGRIDMTDVSVDDLDVGRVDLSWVDTGGRLGARLSLRVLDSPALSSRIQLPPSEDTILEMFERGFPAPEIEAQLDRFDLALLEPMAPRWLRRPAGTISGRLVHDPSKGNDPWRGELKVSDVALSIPLLGQRFSRIRGVATLAEAGIDFEASQMGEDREPARLQGRIALGDLEHATVEATLSLDRLALARSRLARADLTGELRVDGTLGSPRLRGDLAIDDARIRVPAADDPTFKEIRIGVRGTDGRIIEPQAESTSRIAAADLYVTLAVPSTTRIQGQGAQLFVEGRTTARSEPNQPLRLTGEANVVNGTYTFQGRRFRVRRGHVRLTGSERVDPVLDIEAHLPIRDLTAIVEVSGRLSAPIVRLRSEPSRSEQDVLSYILFGRAADEVGAAQGGNFNAAAARLVAGVAEKELREVLGDAMPVDTIEIGADEEGNTSELGLGRFLGPDLFIRYVHVLGDEPSDRVGVEYRLNDLLSIGSSISTTGDAGADLILRHDF